LVITRSIARLQVADGEKNKWSRGQPKKGGFTAWGLVKGLTIAVKNSTLRNITQSFGFGELL
jgi:hypothetical protein